MADGRQGSASYAKLLAKAEMKQFIILRTAEVRLLRESLALSLEGEKRMNMYEQFNGI